MANLPQRAEETASSLLSRLQEGEETAFRDLYLRYYHRLMQYGRSVENDRDLVHDAIQELFVWLLKHPLQVRKIEKLDTYLYKSLRRNIRSLALRERQSRIKAQTYQSKEPENMPSVEAKVIEDEQTLFQREWLRRQISRLPRRQQEVLFLRFFENFDYDDIAEIFSVSNQVVRNTIFRAVRNLRKHAQHLESIWLTGLAYLLIQFLF